METCRPATSGNAVTALGPVASALTNVLDAHRLSGTGHDVDQVLPGSPELGDRRPRQAVVARRRQNGDVPASYPHRPLYGQHGVVGFVHVLLGMLARGARPLRRQLPQPRGRFRSRRAPRASPSGDRSPAAAANHSPPISTNARWLSLGGWSNSACTRATNLCTETATAKSATPAYSWSCWSHNAARSVIAGHHQPRREWYQRPSQVHGVSTNGWIPTSATKASARSAAATTSAT